MTDRSRPSALFWGYDPDEPSFRHRIACLGLELERRGWSCAVETLPKRRYVRRVLERRAQLRASDLLVMHRIKATPLELQPLRRACRHLVYDVDDAIYFRRPRRLGEEPDRSWFRQAKFLWTCATADLVLAGNRTLASVAARASERVELVPTPVDLESYERLAPATRSPRTVVWIGLPENLAYLELVRPVLARLGADYPDLRLRVVSSTFPAWPEVPIERVAWSSESEAASLQSCGIGIMPLTDDDWARGKCAFKLLQYMAAGLPCIGSAAGANFDVVEHGVGGFLAADAGEWQQALRILLEDPDRAQRMGQAGRERVRRHFDRRVIVPRVADLLEELALDGKAAQRQAV